MTNHVIYIAGALATGSNAIKDEEERRVYGGFANVQLDTCYHQVSHDSPLTAVTGDDITGL